MSKGQYNILALTRYSRLGASSRLRTLQFLPHLENSNFRIDVQPLLGDEYLIRIQEGKSKSTPYVIQSYFKRLKTILKIARYDLLWIEKELFPYLPSTVEWLISRLGYRYIVDYDDAIFHYYDQNKQAFIRNFLGKKIDRVMRHAEAVIVGNNYLGERADKAGASRVEQIPTVVDTNRYAFRKSEDTDQMIIGWIGSPTTVRHLQIVEPVLLELNKILNYKFIVIGANIVLSPDISVEFKKWTENTEVAEISKFDIGIMPMYDEPWTRGKCGYKLIQYMACGKPVIASPVEANKEIVDHEYNGFLADTDSEWLYAIKRLSESAHLRLTMGKAGRNKVVEEYSVKSVLPRIKRILEEVSAK